jgi:hypothetical protein
VFRQVPVLPVVIPIAAVAFAVLLRPLHRRDRLTVPRAAVALALCVYAAGIVANTVFPIFLDKPAHDGRWSDSLVLTPLVDYELGDAVMNIAVFVPLGILLGLVVSRGSWWRVTAVAAACSLAIEVTQYVTAHLLGGGHVADVNDLLCNVLGGALGAGLLAVLGRVPGVGGLVEQFRWRAAVG